MSKTLTSPHHLEVFNSIKSSFSDFHLFDYLVSDKLKQAIMDADNIELNMKTTKKVAERYFDVDSFKTPEQKLVWAQIQLIFKSCYVLILSRQESTRSTFWNDTETLLEHYPQFASVDSEELDLLLNFRNMVKATLLVVPARLNKQCILKIAGRLEGSQNEYITGGGQKPAVTRRVQIYEQEGGISAEKRPDRNRVPKTERSEAGSKRSASTFSEKKVKLIRLPTDEVRFLAKGPNNPFPELSTTASTRSTHHSVQNHDEFMSPLSALSVAASRMLHAPEGSIKLSTSTLPITTTSLEFPTSRPLLSGDNAPAAIGVPELAREYSDPLNAYLANSDADFWKEMITTVELKQPTTTLQRNVSLSFNLPEFSETLNAVYPEALSSVGTTTNDGKNINPPTLNRGFSLGFYSSTFSEELKNLLPSSPRK